MSQETLTLLIISKINEKSTVLAAQAPPSSWQFAAGATQNDRSFHFLLHAILP
jgi:hypothetical protein